MNSGYYRFILTLICLSVVLVYKYVEKFGKEDYVFTLTRGEELQRKMSEVYTEFSNWLGSWEM